MYSQPCDGINGLAASAYATQWGAGVINPSFPKNGLTSTPRNSRWTHPLAGVCDHGKQSVGEALVCSRLAAPLGRFSTSSPRLAGGSLPAFFLASQPADDFMYGLSYDRARVLKCLSFGMSCDIELLAWAAGISPYTTYKYRAGQVTDHVAFLKHRKPCLPIEKQARDTFIITDALALHAIRSAMEASNPP